MMDRLEATIKPPTLGACPYRALARLAELASFCLESCRDSACFGRTGVRRWILLVVVNEEW